MNTRTEELRKIWDSRQQELGNNPRSVLFRRLPAGLNQRIHRQHLHFILRCLPDSGGRLLDLGSGYGRMSAAIIEQRPDISAEGVELCEGFAEQFRSQVGPCAHTSVQEFEPQGSYDVILSVTCLQYVELSQLQEILDKYWSHLRPGGSLICVEQYENLFVSVRKRGHLKSMQPTGGDITYFRRGELRYRLEILKSSQLKAEAKITGLPLGFPVMHDAVCVMKMES